MAWSINFNEEKNQLLKATRGVNFEDAIEAFKNGGLIAHLVHPSKKHPYQNLYIVEINSYAYAIPYVMNDSKKEIFLKTVYPSRVLTKRYLERRKK